jgi:LuxR family transcriptional regulator
MYWREDWSQRLAESATSVERMVKELSNIAGNLGFEYCSYVLRSPFPVSNPAVAWSSTYPQRWLDHYFSHNYLEIDPLLRRVQHDLSPVVWTADAHQVQPAFWEEARAHHIRHGWALATHGKHGMMGTLSLARSREVLTPTELDNIEAQLVWLSHAAFGVLSAVEMRKFASHIDQELTLREREVLRWTAIGKTVAEISIILGISERAVTFHITNCLAKLNATNKTQAVMIAMLLGLLF